MRLFTERLSRVSASIIAAAIVESGATKLRGLAFTEERKAAAMQLQHDGFMVIAGEKMLLLCNRGDAEFPHLDSLNRTSSKAAPIVTCGATSPAVPSRASVLAEAPMMRPIPARSARTVSPPRPPGS